MLYTYTKEKPMAREITAPTPVVLTSKSYDGKHVIQFNEKSHRYKLDGEACTGATTFIKAAYPTSMGLISWMKGQAINHLWNELMVQDESSMWWRYKPRSGEGGIAEDTRIELFKAAKNADKKPAQEAADIGTLLHDYAYLSELKKVDEAKRLYDQIIQLPEDSKGKILNGIRQFEDWKAKTPDELVKSEELIASPTHMFCGKFDRLARRNGKLILGDFKSSNSIYLEHYIQLGAYSIAIREWLGLNVEGLEIIRFGKEDGEFETLLVDNPKEIKMFEEQAIRCRQTFEFRKLEEDARWKWKGKNNG